MANNKLTKTIVKNMCDALKLDSTIEEACRYTGISKQTHYNWINDNKFYFDEKPVVYKGKTIKKKQKIFYEEEIKRAEDYAKMLARNTVIKAIEKWNAKIAMDFLGKRDPRYKDKVDINNEDDFEFDEAELTED